MIVKKDDGWYVVSEAHKDKEGSPKNLGGPYATEEEAKHRLKEIEAFKHMEDVSHIPHNYYDPDQPRDENGRWGSGGGSSNERTIKGGKFIVSNSPPTKAGQKVIWKTPIEPGEKEDLMTVLEHNGDRVLVRHEGTGFATGLEPTRVVNTKDLVIIHPKNHIQQYAVSHEHQAEIFSVGKWNNDDYTLEDLYDMARNFNLLADEVKPPVKLGHSDEGLNKIVVQDGQPAYGWVKGLKVVGQKLVAMFAGVPDVLMKAIKAGRYKRVSSEIYWNYKKGDNVFKRVLGAVAFLGADAPAVTNLADLEALLTQSTGANIAAGSFERKAAYSFSSEDGEHIKEEERRETMPVDEKELADAKAENTRLAAALDAVTQANLTIKKNAAAASVREYCEAQVKKGLMAPSTRDSIMKGIKEDKYAYSDTHGYAIPFHEFTTIYDVKSSAKARVEFGQRGDAREHEDSDDDEDSDESEHSYDSKGRTAGEEVDRQTKKYMASNKVDYSTAMKAVLQGNQKLARAYIEATPIIKHESEGASSAADVDGEE
jgi:hypothetical protein